MLSRERIQETLEEAVERGRMTRSDANALAGELLRRGRQQTEEMLAEFERLLEGGAAGRITEGVKGLARSADRARRSVTGDAAGELPIADYDELTARQVQARLGELSDAELRQIADHERRHGNRKTVLDAIERTLG
jgi:polyhydroxyalkanoate synthesis regulator phasin